MGSKKLAKPTTNRIYPGSSKASKTEWATFCPTPKAAPPKALVAAPAPLTALVKAGATFLAIVEAADLPAALAPEPVAPLPSMLLIPILPLFYDFKRKIKRLILNQVYS
jgi:hypothetical protein